MSVRARTSEALRWFSSLSTLLDRPDRIQALLERYTQVPDRLESLSELAIEAYDKEEGPRLDQILADYQQCMDIADSVAQRISEIRQSRGTSEPSQAGRATTSEVGPGLASRLPAISLPRFRGEYDEFGSFMELFDSLVHVRKDLPPALKLAQLLAVLDGEPHTLVSHLSIVDDSYEVARDLLKGRYANRRRQADTLLAKIWGIPKVTRAGDLRVLLLNPVTTATRALKKLGLPVDEWSYILLNFILQRLPAEVRDRFERNHGGETAQCLPEFPTLLEFLEAECRRADIPDALTPPSRPPPGRATNTASRGGDRATGANWGQRGPRGGPPRYNVAVADRDSCMFCKGSGHRVATCPQFGALRVQGRRDVAKRRNYCFVCLDPHFVRDCPHPLACKFCGGKHHPTLCMNRSGGDSGGDTAPLSPQRSRENFELAASRPVGGRRPEAAGPRADVPPGGHRNYSAAVCRSPASLGGTPPGSPPKRREQQTTRTPEPQWGGSTGGCPRRPLMTCFSPPLMERPRLDPRPPPYGRRNHPWPLGVRPQRPAYGSSWDPVDRYERPHRVEDRSSCGSPQ